jgi:hypothetical protein
MPKPFSQDAINGLTSSIIGAAIKVHRELGPGLLEHAYLACLCLLLTRGRLKVETRKALPLVSKACASVAPVHLRELRTYAKLADCPVGLLLNFGAPVMKDGIKRILNGFPTA